MSDPETAPSSASTTPTPAEWEVESKNDFEIDALRELKIDASKTELIGLKEDIRASLHDNTVKVLQYCETNRVDYFTSWETVMQSGDETAKEHFQSAMRILLGKEKGEAFVDKLKNNPDPDAVAMLRIIADHLKNYKERSSNFADAVDVLSDDVSGGILGTVMENLGDRFNENPLPTALAGLVMVWLGGKAWNATLFEDKENKKEGIPLFKNLIMYGGSALAINHLLGPVFRGQTAFEAIKSSVSKGHQEELIELTKQHLPKSTEKDRKTMLLFFGYANVPFKFLINAYERAKSRSSREIDMTRLKNAIESRGGKISEAAFKQSVGRGLFANLEALIGSDANAVERARQTYVTGETGSWSTLRVLMDKYDKNPTFAASADDISSGTLSAAVGGAHSSAASGEKPSSVAPSLEAKADFQSEFKDVKDIEKLDLIIGSDGKATIKGVAFTYKRDETDKANGVIKYTFEKDGARVGSADITIEVGPKPGLEAGHTAALSALDAEAAARVNEMVKTQGLAVAPTWDPSQKTWTVPSYTPKTTYGYPLPMVPLTLELVGDGHFAYFKTTGVDAVKNLTQIDEALAKNYVLGTLRKDPEFERAFGQGLHLTVKDLTTKTILVEDAELVFEFVSGSGFSVKKFTPTERFANAKIEQALRDPQFSTLFSHLRASARPLSQWRRLADVLSGQWKNVDNFNYHWKEIVDFKQSQLLTDYSNAIMAMGPSTDPEKQLSTIYQDVISSSVDELGRLQQRLIQADDRAYDGLEKEFIHQGLGSKAYTDRFDDFYTKIDKLQLPGINDSSNRVHQEIVSQLQQIWFDHTYELRNPNGGAFNPTQEAYLSNLETAIMGAMALAQRNDANFFQKFGRSGISQAEFMGLLPELKSLPKYKEWQEKEGRDENLEAAIPMLRIVGKLGYTPTTDPAVAGGKILTFDDGTVWKVGPPDAAGTPQLTEMRLSPEMVDLQVEYASQQPDFIQTFDRLENIFASMNNHDFKALFSGEVEQFVDGAIPDNRWKSMVAYKKIEAKLSYRNRLLMVSGTTPQAWSSVKINLGDYEALAQIIDRDIHDKLAKKEPYTRQRFEQLFDYSQSLGYKTPEYRVSMMKMREEIRQFDFNGLDSLDSRTAEDLMNLVMEIQFKHTHSLDSVSSWSAQEYAYFQYVHISIMTMLRRAHENNTLKDLLKQDKLIRREEILDRMGLNIKSFGEFKNNSRLFTDPSFTYNVAGLKEEVETENKRRDLNQIWDDLTTYSETMWSKHLAVKSNEERLKYHRVAVENAVGYCARMVFEGKITMEAAKEAIEKKVKLGADKSESSIWDDDSWLPLI